MDLSFLPKDIEDIIINYKNQMEHYEKYKFVLSDINKNISIKYLVPCFEFDTGYLCKAIHFKNKPFMKFNSVICHCCGRHIKETKDEYDNDSDDDEEVNIELNFIHKQILIDSKNNECIEVDDYNQEEYNKVCDKLEKIQIEDLDILNDIPDDEIFEILFELGEGELEDFLLEEYPDEDYTDEEYTE